MKRALDVFVSGGAVLLLSPLVIVAGVVVTLMRARPLFFRQTRPGLHGRPFTLLKFRTMMPATEAAGQALSDADRLTPFGRWLRSTSLDELPELWNVLRGDMSLVGPRPLLMQYLPLYTERQARRHEVRPGITGWAQVNGRNAVGWEERLEMDVWYVENRSFWLDVKILAMTVRKVLAREGISADGHATMEPFRGTA